MNIIVSKIHDKTTNKVCYWLMEIHAAFKRINLNNNFYIDDLKQFIAECNSIWLRRGNFPSSVKRVAYKELESEYQNLNRYFHYLAESNPNCLGSLVKEYDHNKLIDLHKANLVGLTTPETYIVTQKQTLIELLADKKWITKSIKDPVTIQKNEKLYSGGFTSKLTNKILDNLPDTFYPSLVQEKIEKQFEVRIFYLKGKCYSMAIFSQSNPKTRLDFRNYDKEKPNRNLAFQLPNLIEKKVQLFMQKLDLNTGSLDFIVDIDGEFIFLECNPVGQFDWLSEECNYHLEQKIAKLLSNAA